MSAPTIAKKISPMLASRQHGGNHRVLQDGAGIQPDWNSPEYSIVERDGQTIHFMKAASEEVMTCLRGHTEIYNRGCGIAPCGSTLKFKDRYRIRDLFDREYGMTEFHIEDPNECLVFFGERHPNETPVQIESLSRWRKE